MAMALSPAGSPWAWALGSSAVCYYAPGFGLVLYLLSPLCGFVVVPNNKYEPLPAKPLLAWLLASMLNRGGRFQLGRAPPLA